MSGNQCATIDSPHLTGQPTAPTPGVNDDSDRIATTRWVMAQRPPWPGNQPITLLGDAVGRGTTAIIVHVEGLRGNRLNTSSPQFNEILTWKGLEGWKPTPPSDLLCPAGGLQGQIQFNNGCAFGGFTFSQDLEVDVSTGMATVLGLLGRALDDTVPADGDVLTFVAATGKWEPLPPPAGGGGGGPPSGTVVGGITAGGLSQALATPLTGELNVVTSAPIVGAAVALPLGFPLRLCYVRNSDPANPIATFPRLGDGARINNATPNDFVVIPPNWTQTFIAQSSTQWFTT